MTQEITNRYHDAPEWMKDVGPAWYPAARDWVGYITHGTKFSPEQGAAIVAAFSPNTGWSANLTFAENFIRGHGVGTKDNVDRAQRVADMVDVHGKPITDPHDALVGKNPERTQKISNFHRNILGMHGAVTVDRWAIRAATDTDSKTAELMAGWTGAYSKISQAYRAAAAEVGITPAAMQAVVWGQIRGSFD